MAVGLIPKCRPNLTDAVVHAVPKVDVRLVTPDRTSDLVVRDEIAGALDQETQHQRRLRLEARGCAVATDLAGRCVERRSAGELGCLHDGLDVRRPCAVPGEPSKRRGDRPQQLWEHRADRIGKRDIGDVVERRRLRVDDDERRAGRFCRGNERRHGIDLKTRAHGDHAVRFRCRACRAIDHTWHQRLSERHGVALEDPAATPARWILFASAHAFENYRHAHPVAAAETYRIVQRAVNLDDEIGTAAGTLMKPVDVLRDERVKRSAFLEIDERSVTSVRFGSPGWVGQPALPREPTHLGIGDVVADVGHPLRLRVQRPDAFRSAEIRDAGIG